MNPDDTKIALWLEDELEGSELAAMEKWAAQRPEQLLERENLRKFRATVGATLPREEEMPFADFFSSRVRQGIEEHENEACAMPVGKGTERGFWKSWLMPAAACAGMVLAFSVGMRAGGGGATAGVEREAAPIVYTPTAGVDAEWVEGGEARRAHVILLSGVDAIPDSTDFSETVYVPTAREAERTAAQGVGISGGGASGYAN